MAEYENINSPSDVPTLEKEVQLAVAEAVRPLLQSNGWRRYTGPYQEQLVGQLGQLLGATQVGLTCSGSAALEVLLRACRLTQGDEVLLSAYDYPGNFTAIEISGGRPALVDVSPDSWNLSLESLDAAWTPACKVLIASHLHGQLQNMRALQHWCRQRGVTLLQDACQALGASIGGLPLGAWGDATIVSFGGSKVISAGRGGAWCTNQHALGQHARVATGVGSGAYELSELQAAMVLAQLPWLPRITACCRKYFAEQLQNFAKVVGSLSIATEELDVTGLFVAPWAHQIETTAFYQAGWLVPDSVADALASAAFHSAVLDPVTFRSTATGIEPQPTASSQSSNALEQTMRVLPITGKGFDGFHRRSTRRCRRTVSLDNSVSIARRTATLHHRLALQAHH